MRLALAALVLPLALGDVMPHCGPPRVVIQEPGDHCGHYGPRWRGDCRPPGRCMVLTPGGARCTVPCQINGDCTVLGAGFVCGAKGTPYAPDSSEPVSVCTRAE
jgi:hypothetical protein